VKIILLGTEKKVSKLVCFLTLVLLALTFTFPAGFAGDNTQKMTYAQNNGITGKSYSAADATKIEKTKLAEKKKKIEKKLVKKKKKSTTTSRADIDRVVMTAFGTNVFSAAQYEMMLKGTGLDGYGSVFKKMEDKYKVNGLFALAVAMHESALGFHPLSGNNYFGMIGMHFASTTENIMYFGQLMTGHLYKGAGKTTISSIGSRYAAAHTWAERVINHMNQRAHMAAS